MAQATHDYVPAAGSDRLLPFYDLVVSLSGMRARQRQLIEMLSVEGGQQVLDVGCATGTMTLEIQRRYPQARVTGLDPDPLALERARRAAAAASVSVAFEQGYAQQTPYADATFDRVLSSFMFHHLKLEQKRGMLREVLRVLKPGGALCLLDFAPSTSRANGLLARVLHAQDDLRDNADGRIAVLMQEAGFKNASEVDHRRTLFGRVGYYRGVRA